MNSTPTHIVGVTALGIGIAVAIFESAPLVSDALTGAGLGTFIGAAVTYRPNGPLPAGAAASRSRRAGSSSAGAARVRSSTRERTCW